MSKSYNLDKAVDLIEQAVEQAEEYQAELEHNKESMKLLDVVAKFLRRRKRLLYGGYAINALLPENKKFYNPKKELPDFDFLSPDPLTDVAELIQNFISLGYQDVEPAIGIHEGTYKVFVNFQGVADITYCDPVIYETLQAESYRVDSLYVCSPNYLRMNMYTELSRPAGDISRWTKVYRRLLLLNEAHPFQDGCKKSDTPNIAPESTLTNAQKVKLYSKFLTQLQESGDVLLGIPDSQAIFARPSQAAKGRFRTLKRILTKTPFLTLSLSNSPKESAKQLQTAWKDVLGTAITLREIGEVGELVPERVEIVYNDTEVIGIVFQTVSCHAYYTVNVGRKEIRMGSMDTLLNFFFSFYYGKLPFLLSRGQEAVLCVCQKLMDLAESVRVFGTKTWPFPAFAVSCLGYQPTLAELKKEHRERVKKERQKKKAEIKFRKTIKAKLSARKNTRKASKLGEKS